MVVKAPVEVITRGHSCVAFGRVRVRARGRVFLATWLASINERPMRLTKWLTVVACLSLCFPGALALAGTEERCAALGSQCVCAEGLNSATHDGGQTTWTPPGRNYNPDDSTAPKQCFAGAGIGFVANDSGVPSDPYLEIWCGQNFTPIPKAAVSAFLPPGNTLTHVIRDSTSGLTGICHAGMPRMVEAPDVTFCLRVYARWDATSEMPLDSLNQQQKIMTLGGTDGTGTVGGDRILNVQISMSVNDNAPPVETGSRIHTRFDGDFFKAPNDFQDLGNVRDHCTNNFCRFESCLDYSASGEGRTRFRRTSVAPGSGQKTVFKPVGTILRPDGIDMLINHGAGGGVAMYAQGAWNVVRDNSHFIVTHTRPENRNFWPGPACEVEGGCNGSPSPPPPPSGAAIPLAPTNLTAR
jgi:hypothetical protein